MIKINKLPKSVVEIEGEIEASIFESHRPPALKELAAGIELPGFRKGHAPVDLVTKTLPAIQVLEKMAMLALSEFYPKILREHKIDAIGKPEIVITKLAPSNPLGFKIKTAVMPAWELPDYHSIAKRELPALAVSITEEEVKNTIETLRGMRKGENGELPEYNDEFAKSLGRFENLADFETRLRENIKLEKETKAKDKRRLKIMQAILAATPIDLPQVIIDYELEGLVNQFKQDVERSGLKLEEYLKNAKTDLEKLRQNWEPAATLRGKAELVLGRISEKEDLKPTEAEIEENLAFYASEVREKNSAAIRNYIANTLIKEKVLAFLENLAK